MEVRLPWTYVDHLSLSCSLYLLYSLSFLSFFFFSFLLPSSLFLPVRHRNSFTLSITSCAPGVWLSVYGTGHSVDRCLYTIVKSPKHVARTPLSANPPTIPALPRSPALGCSPLLVLYSSSFSSPSTSPPPLPPSSIISSLLQHVSPPTRLLPPHH